VNLFATTFNDFALQINNTFSGYPEKPSDKKSYHGVTVSVTSS
jgi:hypothetical protein